MASKKQPTRPELEEALASVSLVVKKHLPKGVAFGIIVFNKDGNLAWASNAANMEQMIRALRAMADVLGEKEEVRKNPPKARS